MAWCNEMKQCCIRTLRQKLSSRYNQCHFQSLHYRQGKYLRALYSVVITKQSFGAVYPGIESSSSFQTWHTLRSPSFPSWSPFLSFIIITQTISRVWCKHGNSNPGVRVLKMIQKEGNLKICFLWQLELKPLILQQYISEPEHTPHTTMQATFYFIIAVVRPIHPSLSGKQMINAWEDLHNLKPP